MEYGARSRARERKGEGRGRGRGLPRGLGPPGPARGRRRRSILATPWWGTIRGWRSCPLMLFFVGRKAAGGAPAYLTGCGRRWGCCWLGASRPRGSSCCGARRVWPRNPFPFLREVRRADRARGAEERKKSWARPGCGRRIAHKTAGAAVFPVPWRRVGAQKNYSLALLRALVLVRCRAGTEWSAAEGDHTIFCIRVLVCRFHASKGCVATCWLLPTLRDAGQMIQGPSKRPERCAAAGSGEEAATGPGATVHVTLSVIWTAFLRVHKKTFSYGT
jgi:hypothetical protein